MIDLKQYDDDAVLTTKEVAAWLGCRPATVLSMPGLSPLGHLRRRHRLFRAGDVKRAVLGDHRERGAGHRLQLAHGGKSA